MRPSHPDPLVLPPRDDAAKALGVRQRAPRRSGHRAQLTVPDHMWDDVVRIAHTAGTTPNDVLVRLAAERLEDRRRSIELSGRAEERWRRFLDGSRAADMAATASAAGTPLSERELVELSQALRDDA